MVNLRLAFRTLFRTPFLTLAAIVSLALGIGANSALFSLYDQMLLRSLPVQEPGALVNLVAPGVKHGAQSTENAGGIDATFSYPMFPQGTKGRSQGTQRRRHEQCSAEHACADAR